MAPFVEPVNPALADPVMTSMNLLNEISERFPHAVSFAPGRPHPGTFVSEDLHRYLHVYERHVGTKAAGNHLFQYGRTKGIVTELVAANLARDENILADHETIVITNGCQEGLFLTMLALRADERDVLLATVPMYVGVSGAARLVNLPVVPVESGRDGIDLADLTAKIHKARRDGLRPRACYLVPDFANPTGLSLDLSTRHQLLDLAAEQGILLLEDNPYGLFGRRMPTLRSLDRHGVVVYLGSYAKSVMPGARMGYVVAPQPAPAGTLADEIAKLKSMVSVNTSPIAQAVVGGRLFECGFDLRAANSEAAAFYSRNLDCLSRGLERRFPASPQVTWTRPHGGFFIVLTVPFPVDDSVLEHSARRHEVIWTPMCHFYGGLGGHHQLRLSCSLLTPDQIDSGLDRLAALIDELGTASPRRHDTGLRESDSNQNTTRTHWKEWTQ
jgi:(S)-3,5-dihydroxyphenylglycine transaminase